MILGLMAMNEPKEINLKCVVGERDSSSNMNSPINSSEYIILIFNKVFIKR